MIETVLLVLGLVLASLHSKDQIMYYMAWQNAIGLGLLCIPISYYFYKKLGLTFAVFASYASVNAVCSAMNLNGRYAKYPINFKNEISIHACFSLLIAFAMLVAIIETPKRWRKHIPNAIAIYTVVAALHVIRGWYFNYRLPGGYGYLGFFDYCGQSGVAIALGCSFLIPRPGVRPHDDILRILGLIIAVIGIVLSKCAIPFGVLCLVLMCRMRWVLAIPAVLGLSYLDVGTKMINSSHRFEAYKTFMGQLWNSKFWVFGTGLGSFISWAPMIQKQTGFMLGPKGGFFWYWMHSDVLQLGFELGGVGLLLGLSAYAMALFQARMKFRPELLSLGLGMFGASLLDYPRQYFVTGFFLAYFLVEALRKTPT